MLERAPIVEIGGDAGCAERVIAGGGFGWDGAAGTEADVREQTAVVRFVAPLRMAVSFLRSARPPAGIWSENEIENGLRLSRHRRR